MAFQSLPKHPNFPAILENGNRYFNQSVLKTLIQKSAVDISNLFLSDIYYSSTSFLSNCWELVKDRGITPFQICCNLDRYDDIWDGDLKWSSTISETACNYASLLFTHISNCYFARELEDRGGDRKNHHWHLWISCCWIPLFKGALLLQRSCYPWLLSPLLLTPITRRISGSQVFHTF